MSPKMEPCVIQRTSQSHPGSGKEKDSDKARQRFHNSLQKTKRPTRGVAGGPYNYDPFSTLSRNTKDQKRDFTACARRGAPHFRTEAWKIEKKTPKCRKRLQPKSHLTARAPTQHHQCGKNDQVPPQGGQMWPKASQKLPKVTPKLTLFVPKCVFRKLRLDCACVGRSHVGPGQSAPRHRPKRHPPERSTKMPSKTDVGGAFGWQWGAFAAQGSQKGLPRAPKDPPNIDEHLPSGPPGLHLPAFGALLEGPEPPNPQIA